MHGVVSATAVRPRLKEIIRQKFRKKVLGLRLRSIRLGLRVRQTCLDNRLMQQGRAQREVITPGSKVDGLGTVRVLLMNRVSEITTGLISSYDGCDVPWVLLLLILGDIPHRKIVGREIVQREVILSIVGLGSRSSVRELSSAALPFDLRRCTTASHAFS